MMVSQIHTSRDAEWQSSQQVNISSAQPEYDVCPSPFLHPAVVTGQAQPAGHDWDATLNSKIDPFEHTSKDGSSKRRFLKRKICDDHETGRRGQ